MKRRFLTLILSCAVLTSLFACDDKEKADHGELLIEEIEDLRVGESREIAYSFSVPEYSGPIDYSFEGADISIENNTVYALVADRTLTVTASTLHHTTTFTVRTIPRNDGTEQERLSVDHVNSWVGYPASEFFPKFDGVATQETLTFQYDADMVCVDAASNTVRVSEAGTHSVTAVLGEYSTTFNVNGYTVDKSSNRFDTSSYDAAAARLAQKWTDEGGSYTTTLFIGDSFFDAGLFWTDFYTTYAGKDALCFGISATTSYHWEVYLEGWLAELNPGSIVMHIGTNNIYDANDSSRGAVLNLERLFTLMRDKFPASHIYYFGISQRNYDTAKIHAVSSVNTDMESWCAERGWITYLDTPGKLTNDMLKDGIHPKPEYYSVFTEELEATGLVMEEKAGRP